MPALSLSGQFTPLALSHFLALTVHHVPDCLEWLLIGLCQICNSCAISMSSHDFINNGLRRIFVPFGPCMQKTSCRRVETTTGGPFEAVSFFHGPVHKSREPLYQSFLRMITAIGSPGIQAWKHSAHRNPAERPQWSCPDFPDASPVRPLPRPPRRKLPPPKRRLSAPVRGRY